MVGYTGGGEVGVFDLSIGEMVVVGVLILIFVRPEDLPAMMRMVGRQYAKLRRASDELRRAFNTEVAKVEAEERRDEMKRRREEMEQRRAATATPPAPDSVPRPPEGRPLPGPETVVDATVLDGDPGLSGRQAAPVPEAEPGLELPDPRLPEDAAARRWTIKEESG